MIPITPKEHTAWQSGIQKNLTLVFDINGTTKTLDNSDIVSESMSLKQTVSDDVNNVFGSVYSSEFNIRVFDDGTRYKGATLTVTISVTNDDNDGYLFDINGNKIVDENGNAIMYSEDATYSRQIGVFEVVSDKLTSDGISRDLVCYDSLSAVLKEDYSGWHNNLSFPTTLKNYRTAFFAYLGIAQENITLPNDSMTVNKNNMSTVSGATIISAILGLNGCWGYIGMDNVFRYALPKTTADYTITDGSYIQGSYAFEEFQTAEYSGVIFTNNITETITETDPETGETTTYEETSEQKVTVGDATGSILNFSDNMFLVGKTDAELTTIGNALITSLDGFTYTPSAVSFPPYMGLELGDVFQITTSKGTYSFPVLDRTLSGITALRDVFTARGVEFSSENANSLQTIMTQYQANLANVQSLTNKTNKLANELSNISGGSNQYFWHTESVEYYRTQDTTVDASKTYYELSGTVYVVVTPVGTENPSEEGWFEAYADTGSHITEIPKEDFISNPDNGGGNLLARSNGISVRNGTDEVAVFSGDYSRIGREDSFNTTIEPNSFTMHSADGETEVFKISSSYGDTTTTTYTERYSNDFYESESHTINIHPAVSVTSLVVGWRCSVPGTSAPQETGSVTLTPSSSSASFYNNYVTISYTLSNENIIVTRANTGHDDVAVSLTIDVTYVGKLPSHSAIKMGMFPNDSANDLLTIGNGNSSSEKSTAFSVDINGVPYFKNPLRQFKSVFDIIYPVGSVYISTNSTDPGELFGGTWENISGRFLIASDSIASRAPEYPINFTGGTDHHTHTTGNFTLGTNHIPAHTHGNKTLTGYMSAYADTGILTANSQYGGIVSGGTKHGSYAPGYVSGTASWNANINASHEHSSVGGGQAHNHGATGSADHLPPWLAVYMWKRTG